MGFCRCIAETGNRAGFRSRRRRDMTYTGAEVWRVYFNCVEISKGQNSFFTSFPTGIAYDDRRSHAIAGDECRTFAPRNLPRAPALPLPKKLQSLTSAPGRNPNPNLTLKPNRHLNLTALTISLNFLLSSRIAVRGAVMRTILHT